MSATRALAVLLLVPLLAGGCGHGGHAFRDPSFSPQAIASRRLAIGGMVSAVGDPTRRAEARAPLDSLLWTVLAHELQEKALAPLEHARAVLGPAARQAALEDLERSGSIGWGPEATRAMPGREESIYLLFGRIDQDESFTDAMTYPATAGSEALTVHTTTRRVGATFEVIALPEGRLVWSDRIVKTKSVGLRVEQDEEGGLASALLGLLFPSEPEPDYLPPPAFEVVARKVFRELASRFAR